MTKLPPCDHDDCLLVKCSMNNYTYYVQGTQIMNPTTTFLWRWDGKQMAITRNLPNDWEWSRCTPKHFHLSLTQSDAELFFPKATL